MNEVDMYIDKFPDNIREKLIEMRKIIQENAPEASESFAYGMPSYKLNGKPLVYFAGFKNHIGFYATPSGHEEFKDELAGYKQGKGSVQFPIENPLPLDLVKHIVLFRVEENLLKGKK
jgi:uncharacterized protein YdhG (YjbR/CyaY superfamily)